jgi:hypothetical protein
LEQLRVKTCRTFDDPDAWSSERSILPDWIQGFVGAKYGVVESGTLGPPNGE